LQRWALPDFSQILSEIWPQFSIHGRISVFSETFKMLLAIFDGACSESNISISLKDLTNQETALAQYSLRMRTIY